MSFLLSGSAQTVDHFGLTSLFQQATTATNLSNTIQRSASEFLSSSKTNIDILKDCELKILNAHTTKYNEFEHCEKLGRNSLIIVNRFLDLLNTDAEMCHCLLILAYYLAKGQYSNQVSDTGIVSQT